MKNNEANKKELHEKNIVFREKPNKLIYEEVKVVMKDGACFGQWGLIENTLRSSAAVAEGQVNLFALHKDVFDNTFKVQLKRTELARKQFLADSLCLGKIKNSSSFDKFFKSILIKYSTKGEIIADYGKTADKLYIIYDGEFEYLPKGSEKFHRSLLKIGKGSVFGLDRLAGCTEYAYSLRTCSLNNAFFEVRWDKLEEMLESCHKQLVLKMEHTQELLRKQELNIVKENKRLFDSRKKTVRKVVNPKKDSLAKLKLKLGTTTMRTDTEEVSRTPNITFRKLTILESPTVRHVTESIRSKLRLTKTSFFNLDRRNSDRAVERKVTTKEKKDEEFDSKLLKNKLGSKIACK